MERARCFPISDQDRIRKQEQEIQALLKEQEDLHRNLAAHKRLCHHQQDKKDIQRVKELLHQRDVQDEMLKKVKKSQEELQRKIADLNLKKIENTLITRGSKQLKTAKSKHTLEDKLYRASTYFNELQIQKTQLRVELNALNVERTYFLQLHNTLNEELQELKKNIGETVNRCARVYEKRMETKSKMPIMKKKKEEEFVEDYSKEERRERVNAHELNLQNFMDVKCRSRSVQNRKLTQKQLLEKKKDDPAKSQQTLKDVITRIQTVTGEENVDMLPNRITQVEDQTFALFSFLNEQNSDAKGQMDDNSQLQEEIKQLQIKSAQQEQDHHCSLRIVDEQLKETETQAEDCEKQVENLNNLLSEIKKVIHNILAAMEHEHSIIDDDLDSCAIITDYNIMTFLGHVEHEINQLVTIQAFLLFKDVNKEYRSDGLTKFLLGQYPEEPQLSLSLEKGASSVKSFASEPPVTYVEEQPLSQCELRRRIMNDVTAAKDQQTEELS